MIKEEKKGKFRKKGKKRKNKKRGRTKENKRELKRVWRRRSVSTRNSRTE